MNASTTELVREWRNNAQPSRKVAGPAETLSFEQPIRFRVAALGDLGAWILGYHGPSVFLRSVSDQANRYGSISEKQYEAIDREFDKLIDAEEQALQNWIDGSAAKPVAAEPVKAATVAIPNGYYTVAFPDGSHVTLRLTEGFNDDLKARGTQVIGHLSGANNESDYRNFGFVTGGKLAVWTKFRGQLPRQSEAFAVLSAGDVREAGKAYALASERCFICNRLLTDETSIAAGIGPICRDKVGF